MSLWKHRHVNIDFDKAHDQQESPLFTKLPLDLRRHIYLQLWRNYGTIQHIYLFAPNSYLSHYPCLLEKGEFDHHCLPPSPTPPAPEATTDAAAETAAHTIGDEYEPELYDDPGDIDGAIQDITAPQPQPATVSMNGSGNAIDVHEWRDSPWCMHEKCFRAYMEVFDMSFERAYSRHYRRGYLAATSEMGITKPLVVCKKMYTEASESLYSKMAFSFPDTVTLERFMEDVPRPLRERIQSVDVSYSLFLDLR